MNNFKDRFALFLLNPFLSALYAFYTIKNKTSQRLIYLWFLIFGIGFCAVSEAADSFRYVEDFMIESKYSLNQYLYELGEYFTFESNLKDVYTLTVNFLVGSLTNNYHFTYLLYAAIFGFFYLKSLRYFLVYDIQNKLIFFLLLFLFCYSNPIYNINGVRFWTAAWIGVYAALKVFIDKKWCFLLLLLITPLIHGTFPIWIVLVLLALFMGRFQKVWVVLFVLSSFVSAVSFLNVLDSFSDYLPQFMQNQIWSYTQSEVALSKLSGAQDAALPLYAQIFNKLPDYFILFMAYVLIINRKQINEDKLSKRLLGYFLVLSAITNFLSGIPSMGRFTYLVIPLLVILWVRNYSILSKYNKCFYFIPIVYSYSLLYWFRRMDAITEFQLYLFPAPATIINYLFL